MTPATVRARRTADEVAVLSAAFPGLQADPDGSWVVLPGFRLPAGWDPPVTTVMVQVPANYPEAAPLGFFLGARLTRVHGGATRDPGHYFDRYNNPYQHLGWYWYCLEDPAGEWDPQRDSLVTFVEAIRTYLGTPD